jgi:dTDP-4-amino-4,6-dideoxygalactose transaminase
MSSPDITEAEIEAVTQVLQTRWLSCGPRLEEFESTIAEFTGTKHAVGVNSGTSGLHLAMIAAGIQEGDEVITPSFSFVSSANCVLYEQGTPVLVDIDPQTYNIDPDQIEAAITERTKAVVVVHIFGQPADMDPITEIARKHNLFLIEDACEAIGAEYKGRPVGTFGDVAVDAFYPNKQITTGEGGIVATDSEERADLFRSLRNQGRDVFNAWLNHSRLGYNYRLGEMNAALGTVQLQRMEELLSNREQVASWYNERVDEIPGIEKLHIADDTSRMSWFTYAISCEDGISRNRLIEHLEEQGVPSRPYFTPIHLQPLYQQRFDYERGHLPNTEMAGDTVLALPFSGVMDEAQVEHVCQKLRESVKSTV